MMHGQRIEDVPIRQRFELFRAEFADQKRLKSETNEITILHLVTE
jgi:hypothetical protein